MKSDLKSTTTIYLQDEQFDVIRKNEILLDDTVDEHEVSTRGYDYKEKYMTWKMTIRKR